MGTELDHGPALGQEPPGLCSGLRIQSTRQQEIAAMHIPTIHLSPVFQ